MLDKDFLDIQKYVFVTIDTDWMKAQVMVVNPKYDGIEITEKLKTFGREMIVEKLKEREVTEGINELAIQKIFDEGLYEQDVIVAEGKKPKKGIDGELIYNFGMDKSAKPTMLEDGTVDFKSLNIVKNVSKGTLLVTYKPPVEARSGYTIRGDVLEVEQPKKCIMPAGKNTRLSDDGCRLYANMDGNVEYIGGKICISNTLQIKGCVDVSTGNVYFRGDVEINGSVLAGFKVEATGSIIVNDFVEAAILDAGADIVLRKGVNGGGKGELRAGGNIYGKFAESVNMRVEGDVIMGAMMNCNIQCTGSVIADGNRGYIIGGKVHAHNKVRAWSIGNRAEIPTIIEVGYTKEFLERYRELTDGMEAMQKDLFALAAQLRENTTDYEKRVELMRQKVTKDAEYNAALKEYSDLRKMRGIESEGKVSVFKMTYPKVKICIGEIIFNVTDAITQTTFRKVGSAIVKEVWAEKD